MRFDGATCSKRIPAHLAGRVVLLAAFALGLSASARADMAVAWGYNGLGELGNGTTTSSNAPVVASGLSSGVTAIAAGSEHSLAIQNGGVYAWGLDSNGELGNGTTTGFNTGISTPVAVGGLASGVTAVAGGDYFSLALRSGGVYAWGSNGNGTLGNGNGTDSNVPVAASGLSSGVTAIAAGAANGLAIQNGGAYVWGYDEQGELGNGTYITTNPYFGSPTPVPVTGLATGVTAIAGGYYHCLAIRNGSVYAWGDNTYGELGNGVRNTTSDVPVAVSGLPIGVTAIAGGQDCSFAIQNGNVYAWGYNEDGVLGDGTQATHTTPELIDPTDLKNIVAITAGGMSTYALSSDGSLWVWGDNSYGELGLGTSTTDYLIPQHLLPPSGYRFTSIDANAEGIHAVATLAVVPEPASAGLMALGAVALLRRRGREIWVN